MNSLTPSKCTQCHDFYLQDTYSSDDRICEICRPILSPPVSSEAPKIRKPISKFTCGKCGVHETPQKRRGPNGMSELCNKCGLAYANALKNAKTIEEKRIADCLDKMSISNLIHPQKMDISYILGSEQ